MSTTLKRWHDWLPLLVILAIGAFLRFYHIGDLPPGLYRDEGFYGLDALNVLRGHPAIFFAANNGREGLFMYLVAASIALLGRTPEALRVVSALTGTLTILAVYAVGRNLFSQRIALLSAAILAITFWHLALSRVAFRAITLPFLLCVCVALGSSVLRNLRTRRANTETSDLRRLVLPALATGIAFGLTFYTYTSAQFLLLLLIAYCVLHLALRAVGDTDFGLPAGHAARLALLMFVLGAALAFTPFAVWLARHADLYFMRAGQVSILSPAINKGDLIGTLWTNILKAAGMFMFQGDRIWRHNLSLRPVFDGGLATAFVIGSVVCLWRLIKRRTSAIGQPVPLSMRPASLFILLWLLIFLVPTILAEDTPHYLRAIGALPAACIVAALGLEAGLAWLSRRGLLNLYFGRLRRVVSPPALAAIALLVIATVNTVSDYFDVYVHQDMTSYWLEEQNVQLARTVNAFTHDHPAQSLWLQDRLANDNPTLRFLSPDVEFGRVSIVSAGAPTLPGARVLLLVDPNHDWTALRNALPASSTLSVNEGPLAQGDLDLAPRRAFISVLAEPQPAGSGGVGSTLFEQGIAVSHATLTMPAPETGFTGEQLPMIASVPTSTTGSSLQAATVYTVTVFWSATRPITEDYAVFIHWWRNGSVLTQSDSSPSQGYLPMPTWRLGDIIADQHILAVPGGLQAGDEVRVGVYRRAGNLRLRLLDVSGRPTTDSALVLRAVTPGRR